MTFEWFVGLFEGEGYISCPKKHPHRWMLGLSSIDYDVLEKVVAIAGGKIYGPYRNNIPNRKPMFTWYLSRKKDCVQLVEKMLPLLCARRKERAEQALAAHYAYVAAAQNKAATKQPQNPRRKGKHNAS